MAVALLFSLLLPWCSRIWTGMVHYRTYSRNEIFSEPNIFSHVLVAAYAVFVIWWGVRQTSRALVNLGMVGFALAVGWFYFSDIYGEVGRSLGLIGLGILFLAGGWALEKMRRRLLARMGQKTSINARRPNEAGQDFSLTPLLARFSWRIVSTIAAKYLYQRWSCPRVWTRATTYDPQLLMRGRYLSLQLVVDGCQSTLPSAELTTVPRNVEGVPTGKTYTIRSMQPVEFPARLKVEGNKLLAIRTEGEESGPDELMVEGLPGSSCEDLRLDGGVDFYIAEHAAVPAPLMPGQQLWIEVTVPPKGQPRPIQLALKDGSAWRPLAYQ